MNNTIHPTFSALAVAGAIMLSGFIGLLHQPTPAFAAGSGSGSATEDTITAEATLEMPPQAATDTCTWRVVTSITKTPGPSSGPITVRTRNGVRETLYAKYCVGVSTYHWISDHTAAHAAEKANDKVSQLIPKLLARTAPDAAHQVVNIGTWFWVPKLVWKPVSVTAYIVAGEAVIRVTTTATPTNVVYSPGDGNDPVICRGPGTPWNSSHGDNDTSPCMYTYTSASHTQPSGVYKSKTSIEWKITWTSNLGVRGTLGTVRLGLNSNVRVLEMQALSR